MSDAVVAVGGNGWRLYRDRLSTEDATIFLTEVSNIEVGSQMPQMLLTAFGFSVFLTVGYRILTDQDAVPVLIGCVIISILAIIALPTKVISVGVAGKKKLLFRGRTGELAAFKGEIEQTKRQMGAG